MVSQVLAVDVADQFVHLRGVPFLRQGQAVREGFGAGQQPHQAQEGGATRGCAAQAREEWEGAILEEKKPLQKTYVYIYIYIYLVKALYAYMYNSNAHSKLPSNY